MRPAQVNGNRISPLRDSSAQKAQKPTGEGGEGFRKMLDDYLSQVDTLQDKADAALRDVATGKADNLHRLVVATSEAELSFRLMMKTRNKLVEAYKEIMRMKV